MEIPPLLRTTKLARWHQTFVSVMSEVLRNTVASGRGTECCGAGWQQKYIRMRHSHRVGSCCGQKNRYAGVFRTRWGVDGDVVMEIPLPRYKSSCHCAGQMSSSNMSLSESDRLEWYLTFVLGTCSSPGLQLGPPKVIL